MSRKKVIMFLFICFSMTTLEARDSSGMLAVPWTFKPEMWDHSYAYGWQVKMVNAEGKSMRPIKVYSDKLRKVVYSKPLPQGTYKIFVKTITIDTGEEYEFEYEFIGNYFIRNNEASVFPWVLGFITDETEFNTVTHSAFSARLEDDEFFKYKEIIRKKYSESAIKILVHSEPSAI